MQALAKPPENMTRQSTPAQVVAKGFAHPPCPPVAAVAISSAPAGHQTVSFRHPRANREQRLGEAMVAYEFKRSQRRSIGFSIRPEGLVVRAPKWLPLHQVDAALHAKAPWILRKLHETRARHAAQAEQAMVWRDGASLPFLGQIVTLRLDLQHRFGAAGAELVQYPGPLAGRAGPVEEAAVLQARLYLRLPDDASPETIRDAVQAWLMPQARGIFQQRLDHFARLLGVQWKKLALSNARTRWGTARSDGSIRLNWRLLHLPMPVLDYVVAHELSHLKEMNHSPRFWDTVRSVVPDYAALRQQLKKDAVPRWA